MKLPFVAREALDTAEQKFAELNQEYQNFRRRNASVQENSYFQGGSDADMARSLKKIAALSKNYDVFPGHGPSSTLDYEKKHNPYFVY